MWMRLTVMMRQASEDAVMGCVWAMELKQACKPHSGVWTSVGAFSHMYDVISSHD